MLPPERPEQLKEKRIREIINECLQHIGSYRTGVSPKDGRENWAQYEKHYHNQNHTDFVMQEIDALFQKASKKEGSPLQKSDGLLCQLLAGTHDYDQQENSSGKNYNGGNEKRSIKWLVEKMQESEQFSAEDIEIAKVALLGTWTPVVNGQLKQIAGEFGTGENPESTLERKIAELESTYRIKINPRIFQNPRAIAISQLLADADLATLGNEWPIYWKSMVLFFREQHPEIKNESNTSEARETWEKYLQFQVNLLNNHHYHTQVAKDRYPHCPTNSAEVSGILTNNETLSASFEAMLRMDSDYKPQAKTMKVISS
ncbi:MAG: hypothetical protein WCW30_04910 [Candidatus Gracilibacteria bacterium]|jgi:predicted metal-dependent HD superfamily phosphohydrolase